MCAISQFLDLPATRAALGVCGVPFGANAADAEEALATDFMRSMVPELQTLIPHYKVMMCSIGMHVMCACVCNGARAADAHRPLQGRLLCLDCTQV